MLLFSVLMLVGGCGQEPAKTTNTAEEAVDQAINQLAVFGKSHAVTLWGTEEPKFDDSSVKNAQQKVNTLSDQQVKDYDSVLNNLKNFADKPVEKKTDAKMSAFAKWLTATMLLYRGQLSLDLLKVDESRSQDVRDKIMLTGFEIEHLKAQQGLIKPENFDQAIAQSQEVIAGLKKSATQVDSQLNGVKIVIDKLEKQVAELQKQRDALVAQIGELTAKQPNVSAQEALDLQKQIADLEAKRFEVLVKIESLTGGPMTLSADMPVVIGDRKLDNINGLKQLEGEKQLLEIRQKKVVQAIESQEMYLKNLKQQVDVTGQKGKQISEELDRLNVVLKENLQKMDQSVMARNKLAEKAKADLSSAARYAQQADSDLKQYVAAVNEAAGQVTSGEDPFLKDAKSIESLQFSIGETRANSLLLMARLKATQIAYLNSVAPMLNRSSELTEMPESLKSLAKTSKEDLKTLKEELDSTVNNMVSQYETMYRNAGRSNLKSTIAAHYTLALYQASVLNPKTAAEYQAKAKEVLGQVAPGASDDPSLKPIKEMRRALGL
jgi:chromosome segregation ATPase